MKKRPKIKRKNIITGFTRRNRLANAVDEDLRGVPLFIDEFRMAKWGKARSTRSDEFDFRSKHQEVADMWGKPMMKVKVYVEKGGYVQILRAGTDESALHHTAICIGEVQLYHPATDPMKEKPKEELHCPNCGRTIDKVLLHEKTQFKAKLDNDRKYLALLAGEQFNSIGKVVFCFNCNYDITSHLTHNGIKI